MNDLLKFKLDSYDFSEEIITGLIMDNNYKSKDNKTLEEILMYVKDYFNKKDKLSGYLELELMKDNFFTIKFVKISL